MRECVLCKSFFVIAVACATRTIRFRGLLRLSQLPYFVSTFVSFIVLSGSLAVAAQIPVSSFLTTANTAFATQGGDNALILAESVPEPEPNPPQRRQHSNSRTDSDETRGRAAWCRRQGLWRAQPSVVEELGTVWDGLWSFEIPTDPRRAKRSKRQVECDKLNRRALP